ncbi:MAG: hypothetical protein AAF589_04385 [Planctomycetota bacterium]
MNYSLVSLLATATDTVNRAAFTFLPLLAQEEGDDERSYSIEVALILLCIVLGLIVALRPSKRTAEFKKPQANE